MQEIEISKAALTSRQILKVSEIIKKNKILNSINISGNTLHSKQFTTPSDEVLFCQNIAFLLRNNLSLIHLNISGMNLREGIKIIKEEGLDKNKGLQGIHLSDNHFSDEIDLEFQMMADMCKRKSLKKRNKGEISTLSLMEIEEKRRNEFQADVFDFIPFHEHKHLTIINFDKISQNHLDKHLFVKKERQVLQWLNKEKPSDNDMFVLK